MATEQILLKIKKLLALADPTRGGTAAEVETAMAMATKLMLEHDVQRADLTMANEEVKIGSQEIFVAKRTYKWEKTLMTAIENLCDVKAYYKQSVYNGLRITFLGTEHDIAVAKEMYQMFRAQIFKGSSKFTENDDRRGYGMGYAIALIARSRQLRAARRAQTAQTTALVYVGKKEAALTRAYSQLKLRTGRSTKSHVGLEGLAAGRAAGNAVNLNYQRTLK